NEDWAIPRTIGIVVPYIVILAPLYLCFIFLKVRLYHIMWTSTLIIFANEKAIKQEFPYDMSIEAFMEILRLWSISLKDVFNFLKENPNISYIEKQIFQTPKNKHTEDHQRELLIRGTEELIIYLYKQGVRPEGIKIKNNTDPFFETCKKLTDKYKIWLPFLTREHLT
ncbi:MAG: hypothetical protein WC472_02265, partial [Candidatus Paceibacterota bacterium]